MKQFLALLVCLAFTLTAIQAQERYIDEVFTDVKVSSNVIYGVNATMLFIRTAEEAIPIPLAMDIYEPEGDTETERPLVLVFHTGNFLPSVVNQAITGEKTDNSTVEICTRLAKRGYVAAAVDYRTGWDPTAESQPIRALGLIQAAYRGLQDGRNAVRFFRKNADVDGNTYGVDTDKITVFGTGTGGYLTLGMVGVSEYAEIPTTTHGPGKFLLDTDGDGVVETPMVVEAYHGDINGEVLTIAPDAAFGTPPGDTTNYPNHVGYSSDFNLAVNIGGSVGDISWLDDNTTPLISVQSANDFFAPYDDAVLIVPGTNDPIVRVQGAAMIGASQESNGTNQIWKDANFNDPITQLAMDNSAIAGHPYYEGTFPYVQAPNSSGLDEGVVIDWWDPNAPSPANGPGMGIPWNQLPHPSGAGTFHEQGLILNEGMSAEKAKANLDTVFAYVLPRACVALDLPCASMFTSNENILENVNISVSPNPASDVVMINTGDNTVKDIQLYDLNGRLLRTFKGINHNQFELVRNNLATGTYVVKLRFDDGIATQKVMFK